MGKSRLAGSRPKVKIGISLDADMYDWIASKTGPGREFASVSHAIERAVSCLQERSGPAEAPRAPS